MKARTLVKHAVRRALPNGARRAAAEALRPVGHRLPRPVKSTLAFEGSFAVDFDGVRILLGYGDRWIERDLFWEGPAAYEPASLALWMEAAAHSHTIVDIGANIGLFALVAKARNPEAVVVGFEPLHAFADLFERNCRLNGFDIRVVRAAVAREEGAAELLEPPPLGGNQYTATILPAYYGQLNSPPIRHAVRVIALDGWLREAGMERVDLVKIDAEGSDADIVEGMRGVVERSRPDVLIEVQSPEIAVRIAAVLPRPDYLYYAIDEEAGPFPIGDLAEGQVLNRFVCTPETARRLGLPGS